MYMTSDPLYQALAEGQRVGALGTTDLRDAIEHARRFVAAIPVNAGPLIDLGSGGGLPGLVIAWDRPDLQCVLVDRRQKRTDVVQRLVARLGLHDRVRVLCRDLDHLSRDPAFRAGCGVLTARSFGTPEQVLRMSTPLARPGALLLVSEPPGSDGDRWDRVAALMGWRVLGVADGLVRLELVDVSRETSTTP
mgnify:CR=1 FL=1